MMIAGTIAAGLLVAVLLVVLLQLLGAVGKLTAEVAGLKAEKAKAELVELQSAFTPAELSVLGDAFTTIDKLVSARLGVEKSKTTMFSTSNIFGHAGSTVAGVLLAVALLLLPVYQVATFEQISPTLILVVPFLLYGRKGTPGAGGAVAALVLAGFLLSSCVSLNGPQVTASAKVNVHFHPAPKANGPELLRPCWQVHPANRGVRYAARVRKRAGLQLVVDAVRGLLSGSRTGARAPVP